MDFCVPSGVSVVTLTGPNTGGKTASLKALGLTAAMAKAGLFLPLQASEGVIPCYAYTNALTCSSQITARHQPAPLRICSPNAAMAKAWLCYPCST